MAGAFLKHPQELATLGLAPFLGDWGKEQPLHKDAETVGPGATADHHLELGVGPNEVLLWLNQSPLCASFFLFVMWGRGWGAGSW